MHGGRLKRWLEGSAAGATVSFLTDCATTVRLVVYKAPAAGGRRRMGHVLVSVDGGTLQVVNGSCDGVCHDWAPHASTYSLIRLRAGLPLRHHNVTLRMPPNASFAGRFGLVALLSDNSRPTATVGPLCLPAAETAGGSQVAQ